MPVGDCDGAGVDEQNDRPAMGWKVSSGHTSHDVDPASAWYWPGGQRVHFAALSDEKAPLEQPAQAVEAPVVATKVPAVQGMHDDVPPTVW